MKKKRKKRVFTKLERFLYKTSFIIMFLLVLGIVFTSISVSKLNIELQKAEEKVNNQLTINESLIMKINEMASLNNIKLVSKNYGLTYNNNNIKTIE